ncbi:MAG: hypothetical protein F6J92_29180 [Symploca sp. SIO1A3]|nr:hypothetical protein [Symploca sp. SIO2C1]NER50672.1 hypothetical protein [Symploca sp. SIO1A3]
MAEFGKIGGRRQEAGGRRQEVVLMKKFHHQVLIKLLFVPLTTQISDDYSIE